jgi:hypothetical protein
MSTSRHCLLYCKLAVAAAAAAGLPYCCRVHTLVTLGTPHKSAEPVTRRNIDFVNENYGGAHMDDVRWAGVVYDK